MHDNTTAKERYNKLIENRQHYLDRARECSEITIPSLIPDDGFESSSELYTPFQSVGVRSLNKFLIIPRMIDIPLRE
jgi:hypothetical protein